MSVGFRVVPSEQKVRQDIIDQFYGLSSSNIGDVMFRLYTMSPEIKRYSKRGLKMAGKAITVNTRGGDNLMIHKALDMAEQGDILVVSNGGERNRALVGEIMVNYAKYKQLGGIVLDGPLRDAQAIYELDFPIYATGVTPAGPYKDGPGEVNVPIACGSVVVQPNDIIVGDDDGIAVVPFQESETILQKVLKLKDLDESKAKAALEGSAERSWVDKLLIERGCANVK